ncbi:WXG100 family type VII secretion target [Streptosporangium carneum]|uniref:Uncharacterized protein n=1 Tax=Streptosporangium carneum TaxID=47481 RepID=A0A9W6MDW0_9ACTN|nr:hypothetical protein [Streptosporangium carneum]GLK10228.1 hypothetical protein GCM10017600_36340 [Streptosporangium carneum]
MAESAELLRQAEGKELLADRFEGYVQNLETVFERIRVDTPVDGPVWTGSAARRFESDAVQRRSDLTRLVEQCREAAGNLRRTASRLREQADFSRTPL